jgi:hypothetical protein
MDYEAISSSKLEPVQLEEYDCEPAFHVTVPA